jgi:protein-tyrosine phosphatase
MEPVIVDASVEGDGKGALTVRWRLEGEGAVEVAVGATPESIAHDRPVAVVDGDASVILDDLGPGRHYVSVAPSGGGSALIVAERLVSLEGSSNFRDLGGYPVAGGGRTRWGQVFRSDALHALTVEDLATVGRLGLRVVYDLRAEHERDRAPSVPLPEDDPRRVALSIGGNAGQSREITEWILEGGIDAIDDDFLVETYQQMAVRDAGTFAELLTGLTAPDGLPALFHCTAGKDRTGMTAALLLSVLGVDETTILDDYELSTTLWTDRRVERMRPRFEEAGLDIARFRSLFAAPRVAMASLLARLHEQHGTVEQYLLDAGGIDPDVVPELRRLLVQTA